MPATGKIKRIAIVGPFDKQSLSHLLPNYKLEELPDGYSGAPYLITYIDYLLQHHIEVICITTTQCEANDYKVKSYFYGSFSWYVIPARKHSIRFNGLKLGRIVDFFLLERRKIKQCIQIADPDFVHAFWSYEFSWAAISSKKPVLITVEDNAYQVLKYITNIYRFLRLIMSEIVLMKAKYTSTLSPYMLPYVRKRCKNVKVIPNPVKFNYSQFEIENLIKYRVEKLSTPVIIMINNGWDKRKNVAKAIEAFQKFLLKNNTATLHLYGDGYELNGPASIYAKKLKVKNIYFHGKVSIKEINSALRSSHVLLHTSLEESQGVVLIEAMSLGVACIGGINSGAVPWVLNNPMFLTDVTNSATIAEKIKELLSDKHSYKAECVKSFLSAKSRFDFNIIASKFLEYQEEILNNGNLS